MTPGEARQKNRPYFQAFWKVYPRRVGINDAERVFSEIVEGTPSRPGVDPTVLIQKATAYARNVSPDDVKWSPAPAKWLRDGHYEDADLFTDQRRAEKEWLRGCYQRCDVAAVENRYHVKMPRQNVPEGMEDPVTIRQWYKGQARTWIMEQAKRVDNE